MHSRYRRFSGRSLATALIGGVAAGVLASRLLPPVVAMASGSVRAAAGQDALEALVSDHRRFLHLLNEMEHTGESEVLRRTQLFLRLKRGLAAHAMAEEDVAYPLLHDKAGSEQDAKDLYAEHGEMKMLLHRLEAMPKDDPRWSGEAAALKRLIEKHARQEEEVEFPKLRQALDRRERTRLSRDLQREKAVVL